MDFNSILEVGKLNEQLEKFKTKKEKLKHIIDCIEKLEYGDSKKKLIKFLSMTEGKFLILSLKYDKMQNGYHMPSIVEYSFVRKGKFPELKKLIIDKIDKKVSIYKNIKSTSLDQHYSNNVIKRFEIDKSIINKALTVKDFNQMLREEKLNETTYDLIAELFLNENYQIKSKHTNLKINFNTNISSKPESYIINNESLDNLLIYKDTFKPVEKYLLEENYLVLDHLLHNTIYENLEDIIPYILSIVFLEKMFNLYDYILETDFYGYEDQCVNLILSYNENNSSLNYQFITD